jgi:hypothetical protein
VEGLARGVNRRDGRHDFDGHKIYPGIARAEGTGAEIDPKDPPERIVSSGPAL